MKKAILVFGALLALGMTSCKKDWTCECIETINDNGTTTTSTTTTTLERLKPSEARTECDKGDLSNSSTNYSYVKECEVKS